jgi:hypothetical protein
MRSPAAARFLLTVCLASCASAPKRGAPSETDEVPRSLGAVEWDPGTRFIRCPNHAELEVPAQLAGVVRRNGPVEVTIVPEAQPPGSALMVTMANAGAGFWGRLPGIWAKVHKLASGHAIEEGQDPNQSVPLKLESDRVSTEYEHLGKKWRVVYVESGHCQAAAVERIDAPTPLVPLVNAMKIPPNLLDGP